jgi:nitric oxide reductase NorQ protein
MELDDFRIGEEPYYRGIGDEVRLFTAAYAERMPIMLKGPTGCGKTRFVEYMAWKLERPLVTVACHEDMTASDLVGRYLLDAQGTVWHDGPLTIAVRHGAICYLDEIVEARKDTTVIIHPLTDHRRLLTIDKLGEVVEAAEGFLLVVSYNPGYQNVLKDLKHSTRQRFVALEFHFPEQAHEAKIIAHESGIDDETAAQLAKLGHKVRSLREHGLKEGASTRVLIYAGRLIKEGITPRRACHVAVTWGITDDAQVQQSLDEVVAAIFP